MLKSTTIEEQGDWKLKKLHKDGNFTHYVLKYRLGVTEETHPFTEVKATGGLLKLQKNGQTSVTFSNVIDGTNRYAEPNDMPKPIFDALKEIGPY